MFPPPADAPYTADPAYVDLYRNNPHLTDDEKTMFGYISELDDAVGDIVAALKASGQYNNTVIIFSSDNGAPPAGDPVDHKHGADPGWIARNYPFRGWKVRVVSVETTASPSSLAKPPTPLQTLIWEGGVHVAGFVHSPLLPTSVQGTVSEELYHVSDWLPTIVNLAGGSMAKNKPLDG